MREAVDMCFPLGDGVKMADKCRGLAIQDNFLKWRVAPALQL